MSEPVILGPRLPAFALTALWNFLIPITGSRRPDVTIGGEANPYLRRWHLTPRGNGAAVYLHQFLRSDDDRALHDHPWPSAGLILSGQYIEHTPGGAWVREPGEWILREPASAHRVQLLPDASRPPHEMPVWTLFIVGDRVREWGFHCPQGWVHWRDFTAGEHGEVIGRGCDQ